MGADGVGDGAYSWMFTMLELHVGILTACMPVMKLFVKWVWGGKNVRGGGGDGTIGGGGWEGRRENRINSTWR